MSPARLTKREALPRDIEVISEAIPSAPAGLAALRRLHGILPRPLAPTFPNDLPPGAQATQSVDPNAAAAALGNFGIPGNIGLGMMPGSTLTEGSVGSGSLADGVVGVTAFASSIKPVLLVSSLPTLPDAGYPADTIVYNTGDQKLYKNVSGTWTSMVNAADMTGAITSNQIAANAIIAGKIAAGAISATEIAAGAITSPKLAVGAVTAGSIQAGSITTDKLTVGGINIDTIAQGGSISAAALAANSVTAAKIQANSIDATKIVAGSITATQIAVGSITGTQMADGSIAAVKISSVDASTITAGTIQSVNAIFGGSANRTITVKDSGGSTTIGYWDNAGIHVVNGKFFMENTYFQVSSSAGINFWDFVGRAGRFDHGVVTLEGSGAITDSNMSGMTLNGALGSDYGNHRIYVRQGGSWYYAALTLGFEVPAHEGTCPACGKAIQVGEDVIGQIDRVKGDGALHGYWKHFTCAGRSLDPAIVADYQAVETHGDLDADPAAKRGWRRRVQRLVARAARGRAPGG